MFSCAFIGIVVSQFLKTRTREPYENLKRDYSLMPMPSYSKSAIIIRLGYTIGWMGFGVYNTGLGIFLLSLIFS